MAWTNSVPAFTIDLTLPEKDRWQEVLTKLKRPAAQVVAEAGKEMRFVPRTAQAIFGRIYRRTGGLYVQEIASIARELGISAGKATMLNCAYELSHLYVPRLLGCTAGVRFVEGKGMTHVRTLDWPMPAIGDATAIYDFRNRSRHFVAVGCPGMVGVLSGMVPGGYSVTINWAPPAAWPTFEYGPTFLLRQTLETVDNYVDAVRVLRETPLSTSVFFTVCGVKPGEGCVIERTANAAVVRRLRDGVVTQGNHHESARFRKHNDMVTVMENAAFLSESGVRSQQLRAGLLAHKPGDSLLDLLSTKPVLNNETVQKMILCPRTGEAQVWRLSTE